jgi:ubiquinol-cytochrome c reductase iron-sulfur subunit
MISFIARGSSLAPAMVASSQAVPSAVRPIIPCILDAAEKVIVPAPNRKALDNTLPQGALLNTRATSSLSGRTQMRFAHTDIKIPDFTAYRREAVKDGDKSSEPSSASRKAFSYMIVAGGAIPATYAAKAIVGEFVSTMSASADVLALAKIEVNLSEIPEGKNAIFKWRNKPLFIRHRSQGEVDREAEVDITSLRDQQHDLDRVKDPKWLIVLGVCTHLGCVPIANSGDYGGYYCPCHGSHYDASGRIRKGPAPLNLEVPVYNMEGDIVIVG